MKQNILTALENDGLIIGDGAMGTELQAKGLPAGTMPELWNDENAEAVLSIHRAYLDAGAQILTANTFGGNRLRMQEAGLAERATELTRLGASLASRAAGGRAWVAGSVGPTGGIMEPFGTLSVEEAEDIFGEQVTALAEGGADVILVETQHDIEEACAAIRAAKAKTNLPVLCTFAFNPKGRTMMGLKPDVAAQRAEEAGADVVGANCGDGPEAVLAGLKGMQGVTALPLMAQSNAGLPKMGEGGKTIWNFRPEQMARYARTYYSLGARIIGGCCGTRPEHIAAIVAELRT